MGQGHIASQEPRLTVSNPKGHFDALSWRVSRMNSITLLCGWGMNAQKLGRQKIGTNFHQARNPGPKTVRKRINLGLRRRPVVLAVVGTIGLGHPGSMHSMHSRRSKPRVGKLGRVVQTTGWGPAGDVCFQHVGPSLPKTSVGWYAPFLSKPACNRELWPKFYRDTKFSSSIRGRFWHIPFIHRLQGILCQCSGTPQRGTPRTARF